MFLLIILVCIRNISKGHQEAVSRLLLEEKKHRLIQGQKQS